MVQPVLLGKVFVDIAGNITSPVPARNPTESIAQNLRQKAQELVEDFCRFDGLVLTSQSLRLRSVQGMLRAQKIIVAVELGTGNTRLLSRRDSLPNDNTPVEGMALYFPIFMEPIDIDRFCDAVRVLQEQKYNGE